MSTPDTSRSWEPHPGCASAYISAAGPTLKVEKSCSKREESTFEHEKGRFDRDSGESKVEKGRAKVEKGRFDRDDAALEGRRGGVRVHTGAVTPPGRTLQPP